jgi:hypothetical protein
LKRARTTRSAKANLGLSIVRRVHAHEPRARRAMVPTLAATIDAARAPNGSGCGGRSTGIAARASRSSTAARISS